MLEDLELSHAEVERKKAEVWAVIKGPDRGLSDQVYAHTLHLIRTPAAWVANEALCESRRLRRRLRLLVALNRILFVGMAGVVVAALIWSYWLLLLLPGFGIVWFLTNRNQTSTNVELAATVEVFTEKTLRDAGFRSRALETIRRRLGDEAAERVESIWGFAASSDGPDA